MIISNKEYELTQRYYIKNYNDNKLEIKLKGINNIIDMSSMFDGCSSLSSLPNISKWNTQSVINMSYMFKGCESLSSFPYISKWNTKNVYDMSYMFNECSSLSSLPDISKWNTQNVNNMSFMFDGCSSLSSLPNISKWNINQKKYTTKLDTNYDLTKNVSDEIYFNKLDNYLRKSYGDFWQDDYDNDNFEENNIKIVNN